SLLPKQDEVTNLLVPVSLSASHMAFGSIRMEPVFMVLAQSAVTAAALALDGEMTLHEVDYENLKSRLEADGQILNYDAPAGGQKPTKLSSLKGIVVDDSKAELTGSWKASILGHGIHKGYLHDQNTNKEKTSAVFSATLPESGKYEVQIAYSTNENRARNIPVTITHQGGSETVIVNQQELPPIDGLFQTLGAFEFEESGSVSISTKGTDGFVVIDAVRWLPAE
ncbi:MAG: FAD-dependent oxidoreductase, partial [Verrucomicrobiota bacterium]